MIHFFLFCDYSQQKNISQSRYNRASRVVEGGTEYIVRYCHKKAGIESSIFAHAPRGQQGPLQVWTWHVRLLSVLL